jgi:hypothetical protein
MKFSEWWSKYVEVLELNGSGQVRLTIRELKDWCSDAYNDGIAEGLRRAQVASNSPAQGGGSQETSADALKPISVNKG